MANGGGYLMDTYDPETGEVLEEEKWEFYPIDEYEDIRKMMFDVLAGRVQAHEGATILSGALIKRIPIKIALQDKIFKSFTSMFQVMDDSYMKTTYQQSKVDTRLMVENPDYRELHKQLSDVNGFMNALNVGIDAIKMIDRSSWGRRQVKTGE